MLAEQDLCKYDKKIVHFRNTSNLKDAGLDCEQVEYWYKALVKWYMKRAT